jgi:hypothetical protein
MFHDNADGRILKECTTQIAPIVTTLFSLSLKTGKIQDDWRYASVCPAFTKGDKNNPINRYFIRCFSLKENRLCSVGKKLFYPVKSVAVYTIVADFVHEMFM